MTYRFLVPEPVARKIAAYDKSVRKMLEKYIQKHLVDAEDPRVFGKALKYQHIDYGVTVWGITAFLWKLTIINW